MLETLLSIFLPESYRRWRQQDTRNAGFALVNALTKTDYPTPVRVTHAQVIDDSGAVHLFLDNGQDFRLEILSY